MQYVTQIKDLNQKENANYQQTLNVAHGRHLNGANVVLLIVNWSDIEPEI